MKKFLTLFLAVLCAAAFCAAPFAKIKNRSKDRLSVKQKNGVFTLVLTNDKGNDSEASFTVKNFPKKQNLEFSCDLDAEGRNMVYLQVKRFKKGKNVGRTGNSANRYYKQRLRLDFNTFDADTIQLNIRINSRKDFVGKKAKITNVYFGTPTENKAEEVTRLKIVPGFNATSFYVGKNAAERAADCKAQIKYKKSGSSKWINGLDLVYDESRKQFRGSLLGLEEASKYEYVIDINDNGKADVLKGEFVTRTSDVPVKKTITLDKNNFRKLLAAPESGSKDGYIRYTAKPGTVLEFGIANDNAVNLEGCQFIIFENITIRGGKRYTFNVECANDIIFRNCDISGFGRVGKQEVHKDGKYYINNRNINYDAGINIQASDRITVEKCFIHDPLSTANSWFYSHPAGPTAIYIGDAAQVVLRYNDFIGSDKHRWNDAVEGWGNGALNGSVKADAEIYGNYFAFGNDDGMEMDGGQMNCRFAYNKSEGLLCGFSTAPCLIGPAYYFRNLVHRGGEEFDLIGVGIKNNYSTGGRGALFFFNNTVLDHTTGFSSPSFNANEQAAHKEKYLKFFSRNNLIRTTGPLYGAGIFRPQYYFSDASNDFLDGKDEKLEAYKKRGWVKNVTVAKAKFHNEKYGDYTPAQDSKTINAGVYVPGVTEEQNVTSGALQKRGDELPLRFAPFSLDRSVVALKMLTDEVEQAVVTLTPNPGSKGTFKIIQPKGADFFSVTPSQGKLDGKPIQLTVSSLPGNIKAARRNTSAFAVKMSDGWSRPVSVEVDSRANPRLHAKSRKNIIKGSIERKGNFQILTVNAPKAGYYWMFVKTSGPREFFMATINNGPENKHMTHPPRNSKTPWCCLSYTVYQGKSNRPVKLKAGKNIIVVKKATPHMTDFAITRNADDLRLAPDDL